MHLLGKKGQKFLHCPGIKGQGDKLKILPRDGTGQAGTAKIRDTADRDSQNLDRTEKDFLKQENDVLKQENDVLKQEIWAYFWKNFNSFCPGIFTPARDKGTAGCPMETLALTKCYLQHGNMKNETDTELYLRNSLVILVIFKYN